MKCFLTFPFSISLWQKKKDMLFDAPIASGANTFIWIVVILIAFVGAVSQHDALFKGRKKDNEEG